MAGLTFNIVKNNTEGLTRLRRPNVTFIGGGQAGRLQNLQKLKIHVIIYIIRNGVSFMEKKKVVPRTHLELLKTIRRDWNGVNPVTKVFDDKRKRGPKHKPTTNRLVGQAAEE